MDYLGERYPDLGESDLQELFHLGMRFCRPAIPHGHPKGAEAEDAGEEAGAGEVTSADAEALESAEEAASDESSDNRQPVGA